MSDLKMPDLNRVLLAGRLTRDPDLKYTNSGKAYCRLGIANTAYYKDSSGERQERTTFADVVLWGAGAEFIGERLRKGRPVLVEGSLRTSSWEDANTGQKRSKIEINAQRVSPLDWDDSSGGGRSSAPRPEPVEPRAPREIEEPIPEDDIPF
ncbi:MAG: single-stranded DNA-binding protein [Candidatus Hydrogenedentes bacterium]|nr:single-stranded DNA-binding protein [Candidatus Hydrogenedentota bacterium]